MSISKVTKARNIVQQNGLIQLNSAKSTTSSIGLVGTYTSDGSKYAGLFRDNTVGAWSLFDSLTTNPLLSDSVSSGYALSTLNTGALNALSLNSSTITNSGDISIGGTGQVKMTNAYIDAAPTGALGIANKSYVDSLVSSAVQGWAAKESVVARTTAALIGTVTVAGAGATKSISISGPTAASIYAIFDGVTVKAGDRVLVADQVAQQDNGIYVAQSGFGITSWNLLRAADANTNRELSVGAHVFVEGGALYSSTGWVLRGPFSSFVIDGLLVSYFNDPRGGIFQQFNGVKYWLDAALYAAIGSPSNTSYTTTQCDALTVGIAYQSTITDAQRATVMANAAYATTYVSDSGVYYQIFNGSKYYLDNSTYVTIGSPTIVAVSHAYITALSNGGAVYASGVVLTSDQIAQIVSNAAFSSGAQVWVKFSNTFMAAANIGAGVGAFSGLVGTQFQFNSLFAAQAAGSAGLLTVDSTSNANGVTFKIDQSKITGVGALASGTIAAGFGSIVASSLTSSGILSVLGAATMSAGLTVTNGIVADKITTPALMLTDSMADAMDIKSASQQFISFCTTSAAPLMTFAQPSKMSSTLTVLGTSSLKAVGMTDLVATTATVQSLRYGVVELSASTTLDATMSIINVTTGASAIVITLPPAAANSGRSYRIAKPDSGAGSVSIAVSSGDLLDGTSSAVTLSVQYDHTRVTSHGSGWYLH